MLQLGTRRVLLGAVLALTVLVGSACEPATLARPVGPPKVMAPSETVSPQSTLPVTTVPETTVPTTEAPPTTAPATTSPATTAPSTTAVPTTTAPPTTAAPTTAPPTTAAPTTTAPPTTAAPTTAPPTTAPARDGKPGIPTTGAYFGLWLNPIDGQTDQASVKAAWTARVDDLGRELDIAQSYYPFGTTFPTWRETWHIANGRTPLISWNGTSSADVLSGRHDAMIRTRARAVKALGVPVFLRYFWEPDATKKADVVGSYEMYKQNWRHVKAIWDAEGVTNAAWVWCPTAWGFVTGEAQKYYPGDDVVDWICSDGYNWGPAKNAWNSWTKIYKPFYAFGTAHGKPLMAGEWGSTEGLTEGQKAAWFEATRQEIKAMPAIKAVVYFDSKRMENGVWMDWRPDSSTSSYNAYKALARDPYFDR